MTLWENVLAHYGWQGAALAAVLVVLLCVQLWYYLFAYGRIPGYKNSRRRQVLDAEPPLSVIVPMFSEDALFVEERLPLMLAQEYSDFEVVIVYVGRDNDFFEDLLRIRQSFPRVTATKIEQDARFPISTKMALNVGIKSAHYEHLIVTSTDVRPLSDRWLALMAKGFLRGDVVVGYCGLERRRGLADRWMRTTQESLKTVPQSYREGALGLGAGKWHMVRTVVLPNAIDGIVTGCILAVGRIVGESAALLFTAGFGLILNDFFTSLQSSSATLTVALYVYANERGETGVAFAIATILMILTFLINLTANFAGKKLKK